MGASKRLKLIVLIMILILLVLTLLGVFLYDIIYARRVTEELTAVVHVFHRGEDVYIEGHRVIGTIRIDKLGIEYPIIEYVDANSLNIAINKYIGPNINELGNVSLLGHNMRSGLFFSRINGLENGDIVKLTGDSRNYDTI